MANTIWEMSTGGVETYRGNYSAYLTQRQDRWERQQREYEAFQERVAKEMDFIRRNIAGQRTQMAWGKLSRLSREVEAVRVEFRTRKFGTFRQGATPPQADDAHLVATCMLGSGERHDHVLQTTDIQALDDVRDPHRFRAGSCAARAPCTGSVSSAASHCSTASAARWSARRRRLWSSSL